MPQARANQTGFNIMIVHFYICKILDTMRYDTRFFTNSNPADINPFRRNTGKKI